jgi:phosphoglucomutase
MDSQLNEFSQNTQELIDLVHQNKNILSDSAFVNLMEWLENPEYSQFIPRIHTLIKNAEWSEIEDAFYMHVMIGTGGIRGALGIGPNRINSRTIGEAAQGLCFFIKEYGRSTKSNGVVVGHEARRESRALAELSCEIFAASGINSYLFDNIRSTPEVSFAVRHLEATAGVQITASHNPRTDNGFKFYWSDGGQVVAPLDTKFMDLVHGVKNIYRLPLQTARGKGLVQPIGPEVDHEYIKNVRSVSVSTSRSATIVFSPIHGAGSTNVAPVLHEEQFNVTYVDAQRAPDETFPAAAGDLINPEYKEVMEQSVQLAEQIGADVAICSDPDADRIGVAVKKDWESNTLEILTGNQVGAALIHFILTERKRTNQLPEHGLVLQTLVTTNLISDIAKSFHVKVRSDLLVGFKFIAKTISEMANQNDFIFAAEESLGYLAGNFVRDKDASIGALLTSEMVSSLKDGGKTVPQYLNELYEEYGYYNNTQLLIELPGKLGRQVMTEVMLHLRQNAPKTLGELSITKANDLLESTNLTPKSHSIGGSNDIISYELSDDARSRITIRPSGTEPKLKIYIQRYEPVIGSLRQIKSKIDNNVQDISRDILAYIYQGLPSELRPSWNASLKRII